MGMGYRTTRGNSSRGTRMIHTFRARTRIAKPRAQVFEFFSDPANLERITPPTLRFSIITTAPIDMHSGTLIDYRLKLMGVGFKWRTLISVWDPPHRFVDEQLRGPYKTWVHTHTFTEDGPDTIIDDEVRWSLPLFPFGQVAYPIVARQVAGIFAHREKTIHKLLA
jgi:ligand-binding SRPBCC domain-containing protein